MTASKASSGTRGSKPPSAVCRSSLRVHSGRAGHTSRGGKISNAISRVENARDQIGANVNFTLGTGNLFF